MSGTNPYYNADRVAKLKKIVAEMIRDGDDITLLNALYGLHFTSNWVKDVVESGECHPNDVPHDRATYAIHVGTLMEDMVNAPELFDIITNYDLADDYVVRFAVGYRAVPNQ